MSAASPRKIADMNATTTSTTQKKSPALGLNARRVISKRYSLKDAKGRPIEEWQDIVRRVVGHVSAAEKDSQQRDEFFAAMSEVMLAREFVPNTPCLVNAGRANGKLAACYALKFRTQLPVSWITPKRRPLFIRRVAARNDLRIPTPLGCVVGSTRVWRRASIVHEHRESGNRRREAGWCAARCEHGHDARHAS
jgi:hypothetical protein